MFKRASLPAFLLFLVLACAASAHAQTVVNPRTVEFDPSADHSAMTADNQPMVQRYDLEVYLLGAAAPMTTISLGKPDPQTDGKVRVDLSAVGAGWPLSDGSYQARVAAIGPTGKAASDPSNTFAFQSCAITLGGASMAVPAGGASGAVVVNASASCSWTATSDAAWTAIGTASGVGTGSVNFTVLPNVGTAPRTATLLIGGQAFTINQGGAAACSYSLSPSLQSIPEGGGGGTVSVSCASGCNWAVSSNATWVTLGSSLGIGPSTVSYSVAPNTSASPRTAILTIGGATHTISQAGATPCSYGLSSASQSVGSGGGGGSVAVSCGSSCGWTASSDVAWVTLASMMGTGPGTVTYSVPPNTTLAQRTATLTIAGNRYTITQAAMTCSYSLSAASQSVGQGGGSGSVSVACGSNCAWTASSPAAWVTLARTAGTGPGALDYTIAKNTTTTARTATLNVAGVAYTVTQAAARRPNSPKKVRIVPVVQ